jgi:hypothetical protein
MYDKQALEYLMSLAKTEIIPVDGQNYSTKKMYHVEEPAPAAINITTLSGLVDYIKADVDFLEKPLIVHVVSPEEVRLYSEIKDDMARNCYIVCKAQTPHIVYEQFMDMEKFNIQMQSCFAQTLDADKILRIVGNIREEQVKTIGDDGVSQSVVAKAGIANVAEVKVPNPVMLVPYRTFSEVEQPESSFVFRMKTGPLAALFEADGGAWKNLAMLNIHEYLTKELADCEVKIIA